MIRYLPAARERDIVVQDADGEVLVYDLGTNKAYCLNETAGAVYRACDGFTPVEDVRRRHGLNDDVIDLALAQLDENGLLEERGKFTASRGGMDRRSVLRKVAAASAFALPMIMSVAAPSALYAASLCGAACAGIGTCGGACPNCVGAGTCSAGGGGCATLGTPCFGNGVCTLQVCSIPGGACAGLPDGSPCFVPGTCTGVGTCA